MFNTYISERYDYLKGLLIDKIKDEDEAMEILHFTIDYFYTKYSKKKLDGIVNQKPDGSAMDSYIIKALYLNCNSPSAPYLQSNRNYKENTHFDFPFDEIEDEIDDEIQNDKDSVDYISGLIMKLIHTDYVKSKFRSLHHWEYSKKILEFHIIDGRSYVDISKTTNISINTLRYNFRKLKKIIYGIITDESLLLSILPKESIYNIYSSVNEKLIKYYMEYFEVLKQYTENLPNINSFLLKKCASQKVKHNLDGTKRDTVCIIVDMLDHLHRCKGIVTDKRLAEERIRLVHEYQGKTPYGKPGCGSCMDLITRYLHNAIHKNKDLLK